MGCDQDQMQIAESHTHSPVWKDAAAAIAAPCLQKEQRTHADMDCTKHPRQQKETHQKSELLWLLIDQTEKAWIESHVEEILKPKCGCME